jgi:hypothetical protein
VPHRIHKRRREKSCRHPLYDLEFLDRVDGMAVFMINTGNISIRMFQNNLSFSILCLAPGMHHWGGTGFNCKFNEGYDFCAFQLLHFGGNKLLDYLVARDGSSYIVYLRICLYMYGFYYINRLLSKSF